MTMKKNYTINLAPMLIGSGLVAIASAIEINFPNIVSTLGLGLISQEFNHLNFAFIGKLLSSKNMLKHI